MFIISGVEFNDPNLISLKACCFLVGIIVKIIFLQLSFLQASEII
jgi:hypothetical protein